MNFDDILKSIGEFGPYQRLIYILLCLSATVGGLQTFAWVFLIKDPKRRCQLLIDKLANGSTLPYNLPEELLNKTLPYDSPNRQYSQCLRFKTNVTSTPMFSNWTIYEEELTFTRQSESCSSYIYDTSEYTSTVVTEFDLVCGHSWEQAHGQAVIVVGQLIASIIGGHMSDRYGRRNVALFGVSGYVLFCCMSAVSPSYIIFILFRLLMGVTGTCVGLSTFVIIMEFVGPSYRMEASNGYNYFFAIGYILVLPFAYFIRNWRYLQFAVTVPAIGMLSFWWLLPESPRWLMANNKFEESKAILERVASRNHATLLKDLKYEDLEHDTPSGETYSLFTLFKYPKLRIRILISCYLWYVSSVAYYGLALNSSNLGGNVYINFLISAALEFPATLFTTYVLRYFGRVRTLCAMFFIAGISLAATSAVPPDSVTVMITLAMIGKFGVTVTFNTVYIHAGEVFPTVVRNTALGLCSACAHIGGISAPYIALLSTYWTPLPLVIFGAESLLATGLALILPETKDQALPETIMDGELFGVQKKKDDTVTVNIQLNGVDLAPDECGRDRTV